MIVVAHYGAWQALGLVCMMLGAFFGVIALATPLRDRDRPLTLAIAAGLLMAGVLFLEGS